MKADLMLLPHGDSAIDIVLDNVISSTVNARVHALSRQIQHASFDGILGCIPAYRTLTVEYDPLRVTYGQLCLFLRSLPAPDTEAEQSQGRLLHIPVCYGEVFGPDLEEVASHAHLSVAEGITMSLCWAFVPDSLISAEWTLLLPVPAERRPGSLSGEEASVLPGNRRASILSPHPADGILSVVHPSGCLTKRPSL